MEKSLRYFVLFHLCGLIFLRINSLSRDDSVAYIFAIMISITFLKAQWVFDYIFCFLFHLPYLWLGTVIPQRVMLSIMGFLGIAASFAMRACLSIAITEMVVPLNVVEHSNDTLICPVDSTSIQGINTAIVVSVSRCHFNYN